MSVDITSDSIYALVEYQLTERAIHGSNVNSVVLHFVCVVSPNNTSLHLTKWVDRNRVINGSNFCTQR